MSGPGQNFGNDGSPLPLMVVRKLRIINAASNGDYDTVNRLVSRSLLQGTSGNYNGLVGPGAMKVSM